MKASETKLQRIIEGTNQYVVPLFQRPYSWAEKEWATLWDDLVELCDETEPRNHFIGSIVTMPTRSVPEGVAKFLLIDGQQRLTTIMILLAVLRESAKGEAGTLSEEIQQTLLTNPFKQNLELYKLLPTQADRESFIQVIRPDLPGGADGQIGKARAYFEKKLRTFGHGLEKLKSVLVSNLLLVSIVLDTEDNPHLIFESLNAKGRALSQADLIRNYFFMRVHVDRQDKLYGDYWKPMQDHLGESLTECIRHFLMKDGDVVKQGDVYFTLKERADKELRSESEVIDYLARIVEFAGYYAKLLKPELEISSAIRDRMQRLNRIEVTTAYPFLLNVYNDYMHGGITEGEFCDVLDVLENFMVRRWVCSVPTYGLNKIFPSLYFQATQGSRLVEGIKAILRTKNYPRDEEFRDRLIVSRLYASGERAAKTKLLLERIEQYAAHREPVSPDALSVEHVMPQSLTNAWKGSLGVDWEVIHEQLLHTLGNLTLTGYNSPMSNSSFSEKKVVLAESHIELNKYFRDIDIWNGDAIHRRAESLADISVRVWPNFAGADQAPVQKTGVTNRKPAAVVLCGERLASSTWRAVAQRTLEALADMDPDAFERITRQFPKYLAGEEAALRDALKLSNGTFMERNLSANGLYTLCVQITEAAGLSSNDWYVEFA